MVTITSVGGGATTDGTTIFFDPGPSTTGTFLVSYIVEDDHGATASGSVVFDVTNQAPIAPSVPEFAGPFHSRHMGGPLLRGSEA